MCTAIIIKGNFTPYSVIIGFNRDELYSRTEYPPQTFQERFRYHCPTDQITSGTWLGINAAKLFVAILDHRFSTRQGFKSRAKLACHLLGNAGSPVAALELLQRENYKEYRPAVWLVGDSNSCHITVWANKCNSKKLPDGISVVTEGGLRNRSKRRQFHEMQGYLRA